MFLKKVIFQKLIKYLSDTLMGNLFLKKNKITEKNFNHEFCNLKFLLSNLLITKL